MRSPNLRFIAAALAMASLLHGVTQMAVHHHAPASVDSVDVHACHHHAGHAHEHAADSHHNHPEPTRPAPPGTSDDCGICQYIAQATTLPVLADVSPLLVPLAWTDSVRSETSVLGVPAAYDGRGPPA